MTVLTRKQQYVAVGYLGVCFMLMFTAFNSLQNMISSLYLSLGFGSLGQMSVLILYASFGACSFLAAYVIERIGYRRLMFICSLGYCCFNLAGLYASSCEGKLEQARCNLGIIQCVVVVFSALTGMCASFIWVAQAAYVNEVSTPETKGEMFGLFWGLMMASQVLGNILATFILGKVDTNTYFVVLGVLGLSSAFLFLFVKHTGKENQEQSQKLSLKERLTEMKELICKPRSAPFLLYYTFAGVVLGCFAGFIYKLINRSIKRATDQSEEQYSKSLHFHTGLIYIVLGVAQVLTGLILNRIGDRFNKYKMAIFGTIIVELGIICAFLAYFLERYELCFFVSALWGSAEAYLQSNTAALISSQYSGKTAAFSVFRVFFAFGTTAFMILNLILTNNNSPDWIILVILSVYSLTVAIVSKRLESIPSPTPSQSKKMDAIQLIESSKSLHT